MRILACLSLAALGCVFASPVRAADDPAPVVLEPSSQWVVDFGEDKCRLARLFGDGENRHLVFFEQYWPSNQVGLTVAGPSYRRFRSRQPTELGFFEAQPRIRTEPFTGTIGEYGPGVIYSSITLATSSENDESNGTATELPRLDTEFAKQVEFVSLRQRGKEIRLLTGPLDQAFAVLNQCTESLFTGWGLDFEQYRTATRRPKWTNVDALTRRIQAAYPTNAVERGEQGIMRMRVIVSPQGTVEDCAIVKATETDELESPACKLMRNAVFEPALDATGQPMRSLYVTSITYLIN